MFQAIILSNLKENYWIKNDKKPNFGPDFGVPGLNLGPQIFFAGFASTST